MLSHVIPCGIVLVADILSYYVFGGKRLKQNLEQVRQVGSTRQASVGGNKEMSIGDVLRRAKRQLMTKRILIAIMVILMVTLVVFFAVSGYFDRLVDYLISLAE